MLALSTWPGTVRAAEIGNLDSDENPDLAVPLWHETNVAVLMNQAPDPSSSPASVAFGNTPMGQTTAAVTVDIINDSGGDPLISTEVYADGEDFSVDRENCSAGPTPFNGSCEVLIVFSPAALGVRSGDLRSNTTVRKTLPCVSRLQEPESMQLRRTRSSIPVHPARSR